MEMPKGTGALSVKDGDIILIRTERSDNALHSIKSEADLVRRLVEHLDKRGIKDYLVWMLQPNQSVETLSEEDMRKAGWRRIKSEV